MTDRGKYSVDDVDFFLLSEHATHLKKQSYNKAFDRAAEVTCLVSIWLPIVQANPSDLFSLLTGTPVSQLS